MSFKRFQVAAMIIVALQCALTFGAFTAAPTIGSAYLMVYRIPPGFALPAVTEAVALPLLRVRPSDPHDRPVTTPFAAAAWALLLTLPLLSSAAILLAHDLLHAIGRVALWFALWLLACGLLVLAVITGLAAPIACI
jgi:hypothetical protein